MIPATITRGQVVTLLYTVHDDADGTPLDEWLKHPADEPIRYVHGQENAGLPGLAPALQGMQAGERGELTIPPVLAYGEHRPELVFEAVRENLPDNVTLEPGQRLYSRGEQNVFQLKVVRLTEKGAILDGNHPLAGRTLRVQYQIVQVGDADDSLPHRTATVD